MNEDTKQALAEKLKSAAATTPEPREITDKQKAALRRGTDNVRKTHTALRNASMAENAGPLPNNGRETLEEFLANGGHIQKLPPGCAVYSYGMYHNAMPNVVTLMQGHSRRGGVSSS